MTKWKAILIISIPIVLAGGILLAINYVHEKIAWNEFADNLIAIDYSYNGKSVEELKDSKGAWKPTEEEFKEIYEYAYGIDEVVWQTIDGIEMCPKMEDGLGYKNCVPHWEQEYNNARERGEKMEDVILGLRNGVRKNEVNGDRYGIENISKKESNASSKIFSFFKYLFKYLIESAYAALQFNDTFTEATVNTNLQNHIPNNPSIGTGWTKQFQTGYGVTYNLVVTYSDDKLKPGIAKDSSGALYWTNDTMTTGDVKVSVYQMNGDTDDNTNAIACRWFDNNNLYVFIWNEARMAIWQSVGGIWSQLYSKVDGGIGDGSTITLFCHGDRIEVFDGVSTTASASASGVQGEKILIVNPYSTKAYSYKGQIHSHSTNSDGADTPTALVTAYKNAGYDFISITDHNYLTTNPLVSGILFIQGVEETSDSGHITAFGVSSEVVSTTPQIVIDTIIADGGISFLDHPNSTSNSWTDTEISAIKNYSGLEVWNDHSDVGNAEDKIDTALSDYVIAYMTAVDDCHNIAGADFNHGWIQVFADALTQAEIIDSLKRGNFYSTQGPTLAISVNAKVITVTTGSASTIAFIKDGGATAQTTASVTTKDYAVIGDEKYIRIKVTRDSDGKIAWSNPININKGHTGVGMGAIASGANSTDDWSTQILDDFQANSVRNIMIIE